jgi:hypothetical protein
MTNKPCSNCRETKPASAFYPSKVLKSGLDSRCKACRADGAAQRTREWYRKNTERALAASKARASKNPEAVKAAHRAWTEANKERALAIKKKYRDSHMDAGRRNVLSRRGRLANAATGWDAELDDLVLREAAHVAVLRERSTGIKWDVDHVEPLRGRDVCGLHNAYNLAVVPHLFNMLKGNRPNFGVWA